MGHKNWRRAERWWNTGGGYVERHLPGHPLCTSSHPRVTRHRHVMWTALGEPAPDEPVTACEKCDRLMTWRWGDVLVVHHIDGVPGHDERDNLQVLCSSCHNSIHARKRSGG